MKNFFTLLILGALFLLAVQYCRTGGMYAGLSQPDFPDSISSIGKMTRAGQIISMEGKGFPLSELEGKVVFLGFWATWCPPCRAEMPSVQNLYNAIKEEKELVFLMVSDEDAQTVRNFMEKNSYDFPVYLTDGSLSSYLKIEAIPTTFIIDRKGNIVFTHAGAARWDGSATMDFLKKL